MDTDELRDLAEVWLTHLRNDGKAPNSIAAYRSAARVYLGVPGNPDLPGWPGANLSRENVEAFTAARLDAGDSPTTAELRCTALRSLSAYLAANKAIEDDGLILLRAPKRTKRVIRGLRPADTAALIAACKGTSFMDRRDMAVVRLMLSAGPRCDEVCSMLMARLDMRAGEVTVHGKGSRERRIPFSGQAHESLSWYLRVRKAHPHADSPRVWLGGQGKESFGYSALFRALKRRAELAGIEGFHPHRLRHTFAGTWLRKGGSEAGLQKIAGWSSREMLDAYVEDVAADLAIEEARRLGVGE
jgi:site-specific recombinase XerD